MKKILAVALLGLFLSNCTTPPKTEYPPGEAPKISLDRLRSDLRMNRSIEDLGYQEKSFDTCDYGIDQSPNCRTQRLVVIHFRLQCRDSVGTVESVSNFELIPVRSNHVRWKVGYFAGSTSTNSEGYGRVEFLSPGSSKSQRFIVKVNDNNLGVTASEVSRIIVPRDWCD